MSFNTDVTVSLASNVKRAWAHLQFLRMQNTAHSEKKIVPVRISRAIACYYLKMDTKQLLIDKQKLEGNFP